MTKNKEDIIAPLEEAYSWMCPENIGRAFSDVREKHKDTIITSLKSQPSGWQDISTAPKAEGETIIGQMGYVVCSMSWDEEDQEWYTFNRMWERVQEKYPDLKPWNPTHWQLLPQPPALNPSAGGDDEK